MKITLQHTLNSNVKILDVIGELTGNGAIEFQDYVSKIALDHISNAFFLKEERCHFLVNFKKVKKIDGLGIKVLENFANHSVFYVRLFNITEEVRMMLRASGRKDTWLASEINREAGIQKPHQKTQERAQEMNTANTTTPGRQHPRIDTFFPAEFKYHPGHNGVIIGRANVINLSEGGLLAGKITATNTTNGKLLNNPDIEGQEIYDMRFKLNDDSEPIEARGKCMRVFRDDESLNLGVCFKDMKQGDRQIISKFVSNKK